MNNIEITYFWNEHLQKAFPKWECNSWMEDKWKEELAKHSNDTIMKSLNAYILSNSHSIPRLPLFIEMIANVLASNGGKYFRDKNDYHFYIMIQCCQSPIPALLGKRLLFAVDCSKNPLFQDIEKLLNPHNRLYTPDKKEGKAHEYVERIAIDECIEMSSDCKVWLPYYNGIGRATFESEYCKEWFLRNKIPLNKQSEIVYDISAILPSQNEIERLYQETTTRLTVTKNKEIQVMMGKKGQSYV